NTSELHVIYGSGPVGMTVIDELLARGKRVRLVKRSGQASVPAGVEVVPGDATDAENARRVCEGAAVVYNCTNAPDYQKWPEQFPPLQRGIMEGAAANGAKLVVTENLYMYGPHGGAPMTEAMPMRATGARGSTRAKLAIELIEAHAAGKVRFASARAADFYGPRVLQSLAGEQGFRAALTGKSAQVLFSADNLHSLTYIKDMARALVILAEHDEADGQAWHVPNAPAITMREFWDKVYTQAGNPPAKLMVANTPMLRFIGLFAPGLRGITENKWQFAEPFVADHSRFMNTFGAAVAALPEPLPTPIDDGIRAALRWYREHPAQ
ncbi:MAG: NAD-dependent epimerase/dehydratase family protein, partial [Chloroflexi bacterium]|nr:NAD-dependent epimerase/dehydratase family protein [Chloroflexota bacterium]